MLLRGWERGCGGRGEGRVTAVTASAARELTVHRQLPLPSACWGELHGRGVTREDCQSVASAGTAPRNAPAGQAGCQAGGWWPAREESCEVSTRGGLGSQPSHLPTQPSPNFIPAPTSQPASQAWTPARASPYPGQHQPQANCAQPSPAQPVPTTLGLPTPAPIPALAAALPPSGLPACGSRGSAGCRSFAATVPHHRPAVGWVWEAGEPRHGGVVAGLQVGREAGVESEGPASPNYSYLVGEREGEGIGHAATAHTP